jgi:hypothetical protein
VPFRRIAGRRRGRLGGLLAQSFDGAQQPLRVLHLDGNFLFSMHQGMVADGTLDAPVFLGEMPVTWPITKKSEPNSSRFTDDGLRAGPVDSRVSPKNKKPLSLSGFQKVTRLK